MSIFNIILTNNPNKLHAFLLTNPNANSKNEDGQTALFVAAKYGLYEIVIVLLNHNAYPNLKSEGDITPLYIAASKGHINVVIKLIEGGAFINERNINGETALHTAVRHTNHKLVDVLLRHGANPNVEDDYGRIPSDLTKDTHLIRMMNTQNINLDGIVW